MKNWKGLPLIYKALLVCGALWMTAPLGILLSDLADGNGSWIGIALDILTAVGTLGAAVVAAYIYFATSRSNRQRDLSNYAIKSLEAVNSNLNRALSEFKDNRRADKGVQYFEAACAASAEYMLYERMVTESPYENVLYLNRAIKIRETAAHLHDIHVSDLFGLSRNDYPTPSPHHKMQEFCINKTQFDNAYWIDVGPPHGTISAPLPTAAQPKAIVNLCLLFIDRNYINPGQSFEELHARMISSAPYTKMLIDFLEQWLRYELYSDNGDHSYKVRLRREQIKPSDISPWIDFEIDPTA